jgi:hypothetical protein
MGNLKLRWRSIARMLLFSAAAFFVGGAALAQVNGFVVINPISVCNSSTGLCAPFGISCTSASGTQVCTQSATPSAATVNTPIGFVDTDKNVNLTRAFWAQAGLDVAFLPVQKYISPANTNPWSNVNVTDAVNGKTLVTFYPATNYQTLHLVNIKCKDGTIVLTSPDFQALTNHAICTEHMGAPTGLSNPPPAPSPAPPLAATLGMSNALDVFFVSNYSGTAVTTPQYGFSWINGDGVSLGGTTLSATQPRFDTLAHEIGHNLALDHTTFGNGAGAVSNLMTTGSTRGTSAKSGCQVFSTTGSTATSYNAGALFGLDYSTPTFNPCSSYATTINGLADQMIQGSTCTALNPTMCLTQEGAAALSPLISKNLGGTATAGGGSQTPVAGAAVAGAATTSCPPPGGFPFAVTAAPGTGENGDSINSIIIALPDISGISFSGSTPATQTPCGNGGVNIINQMRLNGNSGSGNSNCVKSINLSPPSVQCLQIFFSTGDSKGAAFVAGDTVTFNLALNKDNTTIVQNDLLDGTQLTVITKVTVDTPLGYATTTTFGRIVNGVFAADSQFPDFTTPNQIDPKFVSASVVNLGPTLSKCTPPYTVVGNGKKAQTVCPDGNLSGGPD